MWGALADPKNGSRDLRATRLGMPVLHFNGFGQRQRVLGIHAEIAHCALELGVSEQDLHCTQLARPLVDQRHLRPA